MVGLDGVVGVVLVEGGAPLAVHAVRGHQHPPGHQDPRQLGEDTILLRRRRDVMEHVERRSTREPVVLEVQRRGVAEHDLDVATGQAGGEGCGEDLVHLHGGEARRHRAQDVGGEAGPRPDLERSRTEVDPPEGLRKDLLVDDGARQSSLAQNTMWASFTVRSASCPAGQPGACTEYSSFHQRAVRTSSGSVRTAGSWPRSAGVGPMRSAIGRRASRSKP